MELKADGTSNTGFRLRIRPVGDKLAVDHMTDAMTCGQNLHAIPVMLLANSLRHTKRILEHAVATEQVIVSVGRRIHHEMSLKRKRSLVFGHGFAPERDAGVHFTRDQTAFKDQSKVLVGFLRQQIGTGLRSILLPVPADDDAIFDGEILVREPFPPIQIFAVEQCDLDLAPWNLEDLFLAPVIRI